MTGWRGLLGAALLLVGPAATAAPDPAACRPLAHDGLAYTVCEADAARDEIRLWLGAPDGMPYASFHRLDEDLARSDRRLSFAMNGGMYHPDRAPVGLYIEDGHEVAPATLGGGVGNFGLRPNGVFCVMRGRAAVIESEHYMTDPPACRFATQSGPMLVIGGALHPRFLPDSTSRHIRNGVGVSGDGRRVVFAISEQPVTFHEFARLFRDGLGLPDALFLDGNVSKLHAPGLNRSDVGRPMGPILGVIRGPAE
ncbi:hypothetical protein DDZ14_17235 [Maritimibacter sp. 55A14]|uniref:phosphodiester glycosidase family protein n=1 Tax=Maritimibacter sp. 55A14 TaxID=2174844 RepID=UPI000D615FC3|nr:phosphodiester glycosidase family protein [Maritimibacter sp. 55A14]PWE29400.1 hypothetical protein DDZ14_17235 [Maritimibacter sp. 55A14]